MKRTIESCFTLFPATCAVIAKMVAQQWKFQKHNINLDGSGSVTISSSLSMTAYQDGQRVGSGVETFFKTVSSPEEPRCSEFCIAFHFFRGGLRLSRVEIAYSPSSGWSLQHCPNEMTDDQNDPSWETVSKAGIVVQGGGCQLVDISSATMLIGQLFDLTFKYAND